MVVWMVRTAWTRQQQSVNSKVRIPGTTDHAPGGSALVATAYRYEDAFDVCSGPKTTARWASNAARARSGVR